MLTDTPPQPKPADGAAALPAEAWRRELAAAIDDPAELLARLGLPASLHAPAAARCFPLRVPPGFVARMRPGDPDDPLLRQVLPRAEEAAEAPGFTADPLAERGRGDGPGLLAKYAGRSLVVATGGCALHCRYCFRRGFPYAEHGGWRAALQRLEAEGAPAEVILSGGDPLLLDDAALGECLERLAALPGVRRVRIHSRLPVAVPARVTAALAERLAGTPLQTAVVVHANHPNEIDAAAAAALRRLGAATGALLNQAVLLRGVNDDAATLEALSERLFEAGALPYYLHLLDPVAGAAHFEVDEAAGRRLVDALARRLPGYLVPRLAREEPGAAAKTVLAAGLTG